VPTRPIVNDGLAVPVSLALEEAEKIERILALLPDSAAAYGEWKHLSGGSTRHAACGGR
jgi:hypothetical protein